MNRRSIYLLTAVIVVAAVLYVGKVPPNDGRESPPPSPASTTSGEPLRGTLDSRRDGATNAELQRRRRVKAVAFVHAYERKDSQTGQLLEGTLANGADFPVYDVRVCVEGDCRSASPSTLEAGAQATFSVPLKPNESHGNASVIWRVQPLEQTQNDAGARHD